MKSSIALLVAFLALPLPVVAHIDLITPKPLLDGKAQNYQALKAAPFGASGVDASAALATSVKSGGTIDLEAEVYVFHPGTIVVLWTRDPEGVDVQPAMSIPHKGAVIPHTNLLYESPVIEGGEGNWKASVTLPDVEGVIYLVVRQVMHDKFDNEADGSVSLARVYYHQAAKLELSR